MSDITEDLDRFEAIATKLLESQPTSAQNTNTAKIYINANGIGILVLLVVASFVLGVSTFSAFSDSSRMNNLERRQDRQDDYVNTIYQYAPQIPKPKDK